MMLQNMNAEPEKEAEKFIDAEKEIPDAEAALQGAMDIIAEDISDDAEHRKTLRELYFKKGTIS